MTANSVLAQSLNVAGILATRRAAADAMLVSPGRALPPGDAPCRSNQREPLAWTESMLDPDQRRQGITAPLAGADRSKAATLALRIADYAEPPLTEKVSGLALVGTNSARLRRHDTRAHYAGQILAQPADADARTAAPASTHSPRFRRLASPATRPFARPSRSTCMINTEWLASCPSDNGDIP